MRRLVASLILSLFIILVLPGTYAAYAQTELYSSSWDAGVIVVLYGDQYGTGWFVSNKYIVTAGHVVSYQTNAKVTLIKGDYSEVGYVIYTDSLTDIAIIKVEKPPSSTYIFSLAAKDPEKGQTIFVLGYPYELYKLMGDLAKMSMNPRVSMGVAAWVDQDKKLFEISASVDSGNSGGPITDQFGNVIGLVSFALEGKAATLYYGTSVSAIKEALSKNGISYRVGLSSAINNVQTNTLPSQLLIAVAGGAASAIVSTMIILSMRRRGK
ncbi:trypsin-like peptidase domain-containing serine protease [uncultured archaeal virus]|uniref:Trypsin-like peptidase domain-containing serine protease n=1 Tax=uncultured archaeal virus TaxID=1960247 RepID=A0A1S5Y2X3_9VIRU|nr:trypsin-like peptidase domain-containing serine protease [uncultured archaeal virus]